MYAIKVTPNFYAGTCNAPQEKMITYRDLEEDPNNGTDDIAEYDTPEEAESVIDDIQGAGPYYLSHGEAGAPAYEVIDLDDINEDDCQDASDYDLDGFEQVARADLPDDVADTLNACNVEYHSSGDDYDVYLAIITVDDIRYAIVYCPTTIALQLNADDLGGIDWDKAAYYREI